MSNVVDFNKRLEKRGRIPVRATMVTCPRCGKEYVASIDRLNTGATVVCNYCGFAVKSAIRMIPTT